MDETTKYDIINTRSGVNLGRYEATSKEDALEEMAKDAGYSSYAECCEVTGDDGSDLKVTEHRIEGFGTEEAAREEGAYASASCRVRELDDGTWVAIGDASPGRGSAIFHVNGVTYYKDLSRSDQEALA